MRLYRQRHFGTEYAVSLVVRHVVLVEHAQSRQLIGCNGGRDIGRKLRAHVFDDFRHLIVGAGQRHFLVHVGNAAHQSDDDRSDDGHDAHDL